MNVEFEKEYLAELYEKGKTDDKKHRFQPQIVNGYLKCVKALLNASRMEDLYQSVSYTHLAHSQTKAARSKPQIRR